MRFVTAVFGEGYVRLGLALQQTFDRYNSDPLMVFTDQPGHFAHEFEADFQALVAQYPSFYDKPRTGLRNIFKYSLLQQVQEMHPNETVCWIDADMLIFDDLKKHIVDGVVNVIAHGRRPEAKMNVGGGLQVDGSKYAISGLFAIPPGPALNSLIDVTLERPTWSDDGSPNHLIGDQLILNHLVARTTIPTHWLNDDRRFIFNLEIADGLHPYVKDGGLSRIRWIKRPVLDGRRIVVFYWIKNRLDEHLADGFSTFGRRPARKLRRLYGLAG